jgi:hypothetical protein
LTKRKKKVDEEEVEKEVEEEVRERKMSVCQLKGTQLTPLGSAVKVSLYLVGLPLCTC